MYNRFIRQPFNIRLAAVLVSLLCIGYLVIAGKELLSPLIFSSLFAILLLPFARWLEIKCRLPRSMACMLSVLLLLSAIGLLLYMVGSEISGLSSDWPVFKEQMGNSINALQDWVSKKFHVDALKQLNYVHTATGKLLDSGTVVLGATLVSLSSMVLFLVFTFIYTFLFLVYRSLIMKFFLAVFLEENAAVVTDIVEQVQYIIRKYIIGLLLEMAIVATAVSIAFSIMGVKYAILLGIITGLFNLVPYVGIFTALLISTLVTFATAAAASKIVLVIVVLLVIHLVDSNVLLPLIVGSKVRINALVTVVGVVIGEMIWGIPGMFLSVPVVAVLKIIFDRVPSLQPWGLLLGDEEAKKQSRKLEKAIDKVEQVVQDESPK
ncbi:MAG: AI-2E family transporter [Chitinophagaceae bacterium]